MICQWCLKIIASHPVFFFPLHQAGVLPKHQPSSRRDAATLTEDNRGLHKALCLTEFKTLCPEENEGLSSVGLRHPERLGRLVDLESEEDDYFKAELELMEDREHRKTDIEVNYEKRRSNKTVNRYLREIDTQIVFCCFKKAYLFLVLIL